MQELLSAVRDFIRELGFPIACVVALFWQNTKLNEQHKQETSTFTTAINNNTVALTELKDKIGG